MEMNQKIQICKVVALAILSDMQITDTEKQFITALMDRYELDEEQRRDVMARNLDDNPADLVVGIEEFSSKNELIVELVLAVAADNELSGTERQLLETVAKGIGVDPADMDMLVKNALM